MNNDNRPTTQKRSELYKRIKSLRANNKWLNFGKDIKKLTERGSSLQYYDSVFRDDNQLILQMTPNINRTALSQGWFPEVTEKVRRISSLLENEDEKTSVEFTDLSPLMISFIFNNIQYTKDPRNLIKVEITKQYLNGTKTTSWITVNALFLGSIVESILNRDYGYNDEFYESKMTDIFNATSLKFSALISSKHSNIQRSHRGEFFKYYHNLPMDLTDLGIFKDLNDAKEADNILFIDDDKSILNCLVRALKILGFTEHQLLTASKFVLNGNVAKSKLKVIANRLGVCFKLNELRTKKGKIEIMKSTHGNPTTTSYTLNLIENHYFIEKIHEITPYAIKKYDDVKDNPKWNLIKKRQSNGRGWEYSKSPSMRSSQLLKLILDQKDKFLTPMATEDLLNYKIEDLKLGDDLKPYESVYTPCEYNEKKSKEYSAVWALDTEASTNTSKHKCYTVSIGEIDFVSEEVLKSINCFQSIKDPNPVIAAIKSLPNNTRNSKGSPNPHLILIHNNKYDMSFIRRHIHCVKPVQEIANGGRLLTLTGWFYGRLIEFRDTLGMISIPLAKFTPTFKLSYNKDIFPYNAYTDRTLKTRRMTIKSAQKALKVSDRDEFVKRVDEIGARTSETTFDHWKYAEHYCNRDIQVLAAGYKKFNKWMLDLFNLDTKDYLTICALTHDYLKKVGCYDDVYEVSGTMRDYIQKCVVGGRCMLRFNEKQQIVAEGDDFIQDFDACSLYPSASAELGDIGGFLKGTPKILTADQCNLDFLNKQDGYFIKINIKDMGKIRAFPAISKMEDGKRNWINNRTGIIFINKIGLEELIKYHGPTFEVIDGVYFNEGRNPQIGQEIRRIYDERRRLKSEGNPVEFVYKLMMNSSYGKTIMKPVDTDLLIITGEEMMNRMLLTDHNSIKEVVKIEGVDKYIVKKQKLTADHKSMPHVGSEILDMSKRIMNRVMYLAEDIGVNIYYQDTDSMHINQSGVDKLENAFRDKYGRELIGKQMGQFHSDFDDYKGSKAIGSRLFIGCAKKLYMDEVVYKSGDIHNHTRMRGIPSKIIDKTARGLNIKTTDLYRKIYNGDTITFDLAGFQDEEDGDNCPRFQYTKSREVKTVEKGSFIRRIYS